MSQNAEAPESPPILAVNEFDELCRRVDLHRIVFFEKEPIPGGGKIYWLCPAAEGLAHDLTELARDLKKLAEQYQSTLEKTDGSV